MCMSVYKSLVVPILFGSSMSFYAKSLYRGLEILFMETLRTTKNIAHKRSSDLATMAIVRSFSNKRSSLLH